MAAAAGRQADALTLDELSELFPEMAESSNTGERPSASSQPASMDFESLPAAVDCVEEPHGDDAEWWRVAVLYEGRLISRERALAIAQRATAALSRASESSALLQVQSHCPNLAGGPECNTAPNIASNANSRSATNAAQVQAVIPSSVSQSAVIPSSVSQSVYLHGRQLLPVLAKLILDLREAGPT